AKARARGEGEQAISRWLAGADEAIARLKESLAGVAQGELPPAAAQALAAALLEILGAVPEESDPRCAEKADAAKRALALASSVVQRVEFLRALPAPASADEASDKARIEQWRSIPEVGEAQLQAVLAQRFADWRNAANHRRQLEHEAHRSSELQQRADQEARRLGAIEDDVQAAEAAHAAGQVAELARLMSGIERALKAGPAGAALARRIEALRRGYSSLRDWQRWSGRQGREELVAEAQALERAAAGKVAVKAHAEAIDKLRERWKALDRLGAGTNQALWLAFDGALKAAYAPVQAHLDKLKAAREENLAARNQIIDALAQAAAKLEPSPDWRAAARALAEARLAWQKLGPVEHTVPRKALQGEKAVTARYAAAVQALEAPLQAAYRAASQQREALIAAARSLAGSAPREVIGKVRELQVQWQAQAKALALPRREEAALWEAFKAATDAIFAQRDAARSAKEAAAGEQVKAREDIIARVAALSSGDAAPDIKRALAEADTAWRASPAVPRPLAAKLDARYRAARDAASAPRRRVAASQARFDALVAALSLCDEVEAADTPPADLDARWAALANLPAAWKGRLQSRLQATNAEPGERLRERLLELEVACGIDSPAEFLAARQRMKLLALKEVMEGRRAAAAPPQDLERQLLEAAATPRPDAQSRERLLKIVAAVRSRERR
ncbi:MAG TPA: DUF349 domain-containing protein, partial [Burkholderiales bacterium]|nr:DUF349 domain-containing protein [Burkholderiales bacterium]